ncbi:hypothetical protein FHS38_002746 [Streptomyces netropsis]|uniref:Uncharacterized protein n=1 Tax=Streptomyces netropsis TaxID=55404 RepID=A0A7W7PDF1_STRNE|nr:hypothetical protein [Streptomyces netropsis]GGR22512.1 hypothetical protein GCM10010219_28920 [Streptomyces netropsis]
MVPILVASREKILDRAAYDSADGSKLDDAPGAEPQPAAA